MNRVGVTYPTGFRAAAVKAGQRTGDGPDLALVVNDGPKPVTAAVLTSNRFAAAPVQWSRAQMASGATPTAILLNAGGANACTGQAGLEQVQISAQLVADELGLSSDQVLVCSTGLIGRLLTIEPYLDGIKAAVGQLSQHQGTAAAQAIMTTDRFPKTAQFDGDGWSIGAMFKGVGMISPALATMLSVITTDVLVDQATAQAALDQATDLTFNRLDTDGCMSTNDSVILMASGASLIKPSQTELTSALTAVCTDLAGQCLADAEGASHEIAIHVINASSETAALAVGRAIARSNLFKCAIFGNDPNWGRVLAAAGTVAVEVAPFDPTKVGVTINGVKVCQAGGIGQSPSLINLANQRLVEIEVDLQAGPVSATVLTNDLTHDYVTENAEYSS